MSLDVITLLWCSFLKVAIQHSLIFIKTIRQWMWERVKKRGIRSAGISPNGILHSMAFNRDYTCWIISHPYWTWLLLSLILQFFQETWVLLSVYSHPIDFIYSYINENVMCRMKNQPLWSIYSRNQCYYETSSVKINCYVLCTR